MGTTRPVAFHDLVTAISADPLYAIGTPRDQDGSQYIYQKADDALTLGHAVKLDVAASATGRKVTGATDPLDTVYGVAEVAFTDEYHGWITVAGKASALVADGVAAGDLLGMSTTAGVFGVYKPRQRMLLAHCFNDGGTLADSTTYTGMFFPGFACRVTNVIIGCRVAPVGGGTIKVLKGSASGNTMLNAATFDATTLTAVQGTIATLTSTAADLVLTASGANSGVYLEWATGSQSTDGQGGVIMVEVEPVVQGPFAVALAANSSGSAAARDIYLFGRGRA